MMTRFFVTVMLLLAVGAEAKTDKAERIDTMSVLKKLVYDVKRQQNIAYDYVMNAAFPNGDKDHLKGTSCVDNADRLYLNDCDAFTMLYTGHWLYRADHRKKTVSIVNLDKDSKLKKATERGIFQEEAAIAFLDSVVLKKAVIRQLRWSGDTLQLSLKFSPQELVQRMDVAYDTAAHILTGYNMTTEHPWQRTPKGIQVIETTIHCSGFKKIAEKSRYNEANFFILKNEKVQLKKYTDYKLSAKL